MYTKERPDTSSDVMIAAAARKSFYGYLLLSLRVRVVVGCSAAVIRTPVISELNNNLCHASNILSQVMDTMVYFVVS